MNTALALSTILGMSMLAVVSADCKSVYNDGTPPSGCPNTGKRSTAACDAACQAYFDNVKATCKVGDTMTTAIKYKEYAVWGEQYSLYPKCNLGYTATECDVALDALEDQVLGTCAKASNSPCSANCTSLINAVNSKCAPTGGAAGKYVPTSSEMSKTYTVQTYRQETIDLHFSAYLFDATCVALFKAPSAKTGNSTTSTGSTNAATSTGNSNKTSQAWPKASLPHVMMTAVCALCSIAFTQ